jgi:hypothetical protein
MADVIVSHRSCYASELDSRAIIPGSIIVCTDTGDMYHDTVDGDRIRISSDVVFCASETAIKGLLAPEENRIYLDLSKGHMFVYKNDTWSCLNPDSTTPFCIHNVGIAANGTTVVENNHVTATCNAIFNADPSLADLAESSTISCTCSASSISITSDCKYALCGVIEVTPG